MRHINLFILCGLSAICMCGEAVAQNANTITINWINKTKHSVGLETSPINTPTNAQWSITPSSIDAGSTGTSTQTTSDSIGERAFHIEVGGTQSGVAPSDVYGSEESCEVYSNVYGPDSTWAGPGCRQDYKFKVSEKKISRHGPKCTQVKLNYIPGTCSLVADVEITSDW